MNRLRLPVAAHLLLVRGDEVLRQNNTGYEDGNSCVPARHCGPYVAHEIRCWHAGIPISQVGPGLTG